MFAPKNWNNEVLSVCSKILEKHEVPSVCRWLYSVGIIIPNIWKNKTCYKPQTNDVFYVLRVNIRVSTRVGCILAPSDVAVRGRIPPSASGCGHGFKKERLSWGLIWGLIGF